MWPIVQKPPASAAEAPASTSVSARPDRRYDCAYHRAARMPDPAHSGWPAEYQTAGASINEVVPISAMAASPRPVRPVSRATSRPVISITATRIA